MVFHLASDVNCNWDGWLVSKLCITAHTHSSTSWERWRWFCTLTLLEDVVAQVSVLVPMARQCDYSVGCKSLVQSVFAHVFVSFLFNLIVC